MGDKTLVDAFKKQIREQLTGFFKSNECSKETAALFKRALRDLSDEVEDLYFDVTDPGA